MTREILTAPSTWGDEMGKLNRNFIELYADKLDSSQKGAANGVATLDASQRIPTAQLPSSIVGALVYVGGWNAATNTPALPAATTNRGNYYTVTTGGASSVPTGASVTYGVGDWVVSNGTTYDRVLAQSPVQSVAGKTGAVALVKADVGLGNVDNTSDADKLSTTAPAALAATAATGTGTKAARSDHVHALPSQLHNGTRVVVNFSAATSTIESPTANKVRITFTDSAIRFFRENTDMGGIDSANEGWFFNTRNNQGSILLNEATGTGATMLFRSGRGTSGKAELNGIRFWCGDEQTSMELNNGSGSYTRIFCFKDTAVVNINGNEILRMHPQEVRVGGELYPVSDGTKYLGYNAGRWREIWCTQSSINSTSDQRKKTALREIPDALLDGWGLHVRWGMFEWLDGVDTKTQFGLIAQDAIKAFEHAGLEWKDFAAITGSENLEDGGLAALYGALQVIENAYQRRRLDRIESALGM